MSRLRRSLPLCLVLCVGLLAGSLLPIGMSVADDEVQPKAKAETVPELVALGRLTANDMWTTFVLLGMLERGASAGAFQDRQHLGQTIGARLQMNRLAIDHLGRVKDLPKMAPAEKVFLGEVQKCYGLLDAHAHALIKALDAKSADTVAALDAARRAAWAKVKVLLGLK